MKGPHPNDVLVGANIRLHRLAAHMPQTELAEHLGVTFQQIQKYERGTNRVGAGRLLTLAQALKVPVSALFEGAKGGTAKSSHPLALLVKTDAYRLAEAFDKIEDQRVRQSLVALVVNLSER
jgi:transcriptional regulator with XRE-family HTH domain